jgi:hypothetical protein
MSEGRCFVIQPFDKGKFDKRYDDVFSPAILDAGLEPYRVDRDPGVVTLIDSIMEEVRTAAACLADITTDNPNIWFEAGLALAGQKDLVLVCSRERVTKMPFDVQHRNVLFYETESLSDFDALRASITERLKALIKKRGELQSISSMSPLQTTEGLTPHEVAALVCIAEARKSPEDSLDIQSIRQAMRSAGFNDLAITLSLESLLKKKMVTYSPHQYRDAVYSLTDDGVEWLLRNQQRFDLRATASQQAESPPDETSHW